MGSVWKPIVGKTVGKNGHKKWKPLRCKGFRASKWRDSNPRPFGPEPNALPNCATPRFAGADKGTRTPDLLITNQPLYQLSYIGMTSTHDYSKDQAICPALEADIFHFGRERPAEQKMAGRRPYPPPGWGVTCRQCPGPSGSSIVDGWSFGWLRRSWGRSFRPRTCHAGSAGTGGRRSYCP